MSKVKIQIGKINTTKSKREMIEDAGHTFQRNDDGEMVISVKFPGTDALLFRRQDLALVAERLEAATPVGDGPGPTFARTANEDADGTLTAKFSDGKRARSITFNADERIEIADYIMGILNSWEGYADQLRSVEEEKASAAATSADAPNETPNEAAAK